MNEIPKVRPRVLVAEDHGPSRLALQALLTQHGFDVSTAASGDEAAEILHAFDPPALALLDWIMPGMTGLELCRALRARDDGPYTYLIVVTGRDDASDLSKAFDAGADDFIRKPLEPVELLARLNSGRRIVELEHRLAARVEEVQRALERVRALERLLPICMYCKRVRKNPEFWQAIEEYIHVETGTDFSHGICPDCLTTMQVGARGSRSGSTPRPAFDFEPPLG